MKKKIIEFLNRKEHYYLAPLDNPERLKKFNLKDIKEGYTGVTVNFLYEHVLNKEYPWNDLVNLLVELSDTKVISSLYCRGVQDIVFENGECRTSHWGYVKGRESPFSITSSYSFFIESMMNKIKDND